MENISRCLVYCLCALSSCCFAATEVSINNDEIIYQGTLSADANLKAFSLYETAKVKPTIFVIESHGGPIDIGLELGEWIFARGMDVKVDSFCFSSCANYIFTAGAKKYLGKDGVVGFHGGASSDNFNMSKMNATLAKIPVYQREKVREDLEQQLKRYVETNRERESAFYARIKVSQKITTLGHENIYSIYQKTGFKGWYYSLEDMARLGLKNIQAKGNWNPERQEKRYKIFRVSLDNINTTF